MSWETIEIVLGTVLCLLIVFSMMVVIRGFYRMFFKGESWDIPEFVQSAMKIAVGYLLVMRLEDLLHMLVVLSN